MHISLSLTLLVALTAAVQAQSNAINIQDMTTPLHSIVFSPTVGATLKPGVVVDMSRPQFILKESSQLECTVDPIVPVSAVSVSVATREDKSTTYRQVALAVEASLSFFGAGKMELSNEEVNKLRQSSLYARLAVIDGVQSLGTKRPKWPGDWKLPAQGDPADRMKAFVSEYGTHYIHKLYSGRTISIKATMRESEQARRDALEAKLRAQFLSFSLDGKFVQEAKAETANYQFDLFITVQGGKADMPERLLLRSFDELDKFIKELQSGQFKIASAPVAADLLSLSGLTGDSGLNAALRGDIKLNDPREMHTMKAELLNELGDKIAATNSRVDFRRIQVAVTGRDRSVEQVVEFEGVVEAAEAAIARVHMHHRDRDDNETEQFAAAVEVVKVDGKHVTIRTSCWMHDAANHHASNGGVSVVVMARLGPARK